MFPSITCDIFINNKLHYFVFAIFSLTIPDHSSRPTPILPQDNILARLLRSFPDLVYKYHEHDSLLENKVEQELSEQEKNEAWTAYERDLQMNSEINEKPNTEE